MPFDVNQSCASLRVPGDGISSSSSTINLDQGDSFNVKQEPESPGQDYEEHGDFNEGNGEEEAEEEEEEEEEEEGINQDSDDGEDEDEDEESPEDQVKKGPVRLRIDMSSIPCVSNEDQVSELQELGVVAYEQQSYEKGVLKQVDSVMNSQVIGKKPKETDTHKKRLADILSFDKRPTVKIEEETHDGYDHLQPSTSSSPDKLSSSINLQESEAITTNSNFNRATSSSEVLQRFRNFQLSQNRHYDNDDDDEEMEDEESERIDSKSSKRFRQKEDTDDYVPSDGEEDDYNEEIGDIDDQEYGGDADEIQSKRKKVGKKVSKKIKLEAGPEKVTKKKILDDGDEVAYQKRMRAVKLEIQRQVDANEIITYENCHTVEGDFKVPEHIWSKLYNYQQRGVQWLWELHQLGCGGILGDEMGLGKTIQVIAFLAGLASSEISNFRDERKTLGPVILVTPATVMNQWVSEFQAWWPFLRVAILHHTGSFHGKKKKLVGIINRCNGILITSYCSIVTFQDLLYEYDWHYVILDEGHKIRNPDAQTTLACKRFRTPHRIILSGSPIQNNLKELWSLFDFIYPGKLGTLPVFMEKFSVPITQGGYANASQIQVEIAYRCATVLRDAIKPYLLRRVKDEVQMVLNLPTKNEQVLFCRLTDEQRDVYKTYLESNTIRDIFKGKMQIFVGLINLRKICNHPDLFTDGPKEETGEVKDTFGYYKRSGKMKVVDVLLSLWHKQGHKVLLFTQGKQMLNILEMFLRYREYTYLLMDGSTPIGTRQQTVREFNSNPNIFVFLLTTKVGGVGLNLIGANRVLIYDPDWNPTTDMQARERAWRIGQDKQVTIYRLLTAGTVEEKIYHRQVFKQYLTNRVLKDPKQQRFFKTNDLHELFTLGNDSATTESSALFAGTGSKVKINKSAKNVTKKSKDKSSRTMSSSTEKITLPPEKIKELQEKAKKLSKMIADKFNSNSNTSSPLSSSSSHCTKKSDTQPICDSSFPSSSSSSSTTTTTAQSPMYKNYHKPESSKKSTKSKKHKGTIFEGKRIKYLVKSDTYNQESAKPSTSSTITSEDNIDKQQDDYVLKKLFKKSTMHSALQHDVIEGKTNTDFVLVESEAEKVANEAIKALRRSRQMCYAPAAGIPTWTGSSTTLPNNNGINKFGKGRRDRLPGSSASTSASDGGSSSVMSSAALIASIKARNKFERPERVEGDDDNEDFAGDQHGPTSQDDCSSEHNELLNDIRNFIAFQASVDGEATTQEILERFKDRIPASLTPVFKSLLWKISDFHRRSDKTGVWKIKGEFR